MRFDADLVRVALERSRPTRRVEWPGALPAAVLVPIRFEPEPIVSLVVRSRHLAAHPGEVAFPGGKPERGETLLEAAYRETEEEVGLRASDLEHLGELSAVPVVTGRYLIHPFVACIVNEHRPVVASGEIERVIETPLLAWLRGELTRQAFATEWRGNRFTMPQFPIDGALLFGATAIVFLELLTQIAGALGVSLPEPELVEEPLWARS